MTAGGAADGPGADAEGDGLREEGHGGLRAEREALAGIGAHVRLAVGRPGRVQGQGASGDWAGAVCVLEEEGAERD